MHLSVRLSVKGFLVILIIALVTLAGIIRAEPAPGTKCTETGESETCDSFNTLLGCFYNQEMKEFSCKCIYVKIDPYLIDMEWDSREKKCLSRANSACNLVKGTSNEVDIPDLGTIKFSSVDCKAGLTCRESSKQLPKEFGVCSSMIPTVFNSLIIFSLVTQLVSRKLYYLALNY